jgi:hypothetical protein
LIKKDRRKLTFRGRVVDEVHKLAVKFVPQLRDNHVLVARKVNTYEEMIITAPKVVNDMDAWIAQRHKFNN